MKNEPEHCVGHEEETDLCKGPHEEEGEDVSVEILFTEVRELEQEKFGDGFSREAGG